MSGIAVQRASRAYEIRVSLHSVALDEEDRVVARGKGDGDDIDGGLEERAKRKLERDPSR